MNQTTKTRHDRNRDLKETIRRCRCWLNDAESSNTVEDPDKAMPYLYEMQNFLKNNLPPQNLQANANSSNSKKMRKVIAKNKPLHVPR